MQGRGPGDHSQSCLSQGQSRVFQRQQLPSCCTGLWPKQQWHPWPVSHPGCCATKWSSQHKHLTWAQAPQAPHSSYLQAPLQDQCNPRLKQNHKVEAFGFLDSICSLTWNTSHPQKECTLCLSGSDLCPSPSWVSPTPCRGRQPFLWEQKGLSVLKPPCCVKLMKSLCT